MAIATALALTALAGCSTMGQSPAVSADITGTIPVRATVAVAASVDSSDWEAVRRTIAALPAGPTPTVDWSNPDTGSTGALTVGATAAGKDTLCRAFVTTISDPHGVRRFRGTACRGIDGRWQLKGVVPDDALLS
jgi:surface antigen